MGDDPHAREAELLIEQDGALVAGYHGIELQAREAKGCELAEAVLDERVPDAAPTHCRGNGIARIRHMRAPSDVVGVEDVEATDALRQGCAAIFGIRDSLNGDRSARLLAEERERFGVRPKRRGLRERISCLDHLVPDGAHGAHIL